MKIEITERLSSTGYLAGSPAILREYLSGAIKPDSWNPS